MSEIIQNYDEETNKNIEKNNNEKLKEDFLEVLVNQEKVIEDENEIENKDNSNLNNTYDNSLNNEIQDKINDKHNENENENEELYRKKAKILYIFKRKGINKFNSQTPYSILKCEFEELKREEDMSGMLNLTKSAILFFISILEKFTNRLTIFDLEGWNEHVTIEMDDKKYDDVLEELYEKHRSKMFDSPEIKLLSMLIFSAITFNMSKMVAKKAMENEETFSIPNINIDEIMSQSNKKENLIGNEEKEEISGNNDTVIEIPKKSSSSSGSINTKRRQNKKKKEEIVELNLDF
jgi:hypothetical protein